MARFIYPLDNILRIKERLEEQKQAELGVAIGYFETEKAEEARIRQNLDERLAEFAAGQGGSTNASELQHASAKVAFEEQVLRDQMMKVAKAEKAVDKAREALKKALEERKIQETLKEKAFERHMEEEKQKEQHILDEIVGYRYAVDREE